MSDVTIVSCYNDEKMYQDFVSTVKAQSVPCEVIGIDNRGNRAFTSCAAAYNSVIDRVRTKYVVYSHQDILLKGLDCLGKFVGFLEGLGRDDILGVAGVRFDVLGTYANFMHVDNMTGELRSAGKHQFSGGIMECDTVDECFFGGRTEHFRENPFDEVVCDDWHLYAAEACLNTKSNYVRGGGHAYICDINLVHLSNGSVKFPFIRGFCKLCRKYADKFPFIRVTCGYSKTDKFHLFLYVLKHYLYTRPRKAVRKILISLGLYHKLRRLLKRE